MGKWTGGDKPVELHDCVGFLDKEINLEGVLNVAAGTFRIDGKVKGTVNCKDRLVLSENAQVEGEIECANISVGGKIRGNIRATNCVEILPTGVIEGEVYTNSLVIAAGGVLEGQSHMRAEAKAAAVGRDKAQRLVAVTSEGASS